MSSKKKVLIITYYWPPAGGSGVQRWLKFSKYLRDFEIEPVVYTIDNPSYPILDKSSESEIPKDLEILKQPIFEPNSLLSIFGSTSKKESAGFLNPNPTFFGSIIQYIRANYFIPDARKFWIQPSVNFLSNYLEKNYIDAIITTGPPHSMHIIGLELKKKLGIKWISDFRDPWTEIDYFQQLPLTKKATKKHQDLEQEVLINSDMVVVVGETMKEKFLKHTKRIEVLTNGFDTIETSLTQELDEKFSITHVGLMNSDRNPTILWEVLNEISNTNPSFKNDLRIKLIGKIDDAVIQDLEVFDHNTIETIPYLDHKDISKYQASSQVLLLSINEVPSAKGIITGKIFEYLQAKRPILAIGPEDGDAAMILKNTNAGIIVGFKNETALKATILNLYKDYKQGVLFVKSIDIEQYHRKNITSQLAEVIKKVVS
ncbi:MAG: glycosyl transferase family 1 [Gammaproteobacteria bacterium]|nr:glycosyl transferase family 1 [Gammaproteobacteria bacterium]